jgi:hypothetical protein
MQKVEGSNPFSRFASNPLQLGGLALPGETQTTPAYSPPVSTIGPPRGDPRLTPSVQRGAGEATDA